VRKPKFNNPRAIIVLAEQNSWATCGSLRQRHSSCTPTWIFLANFAAVVRCAVHQKAKVQQCTCHYCASPAKKMGDLMSSHKSAVRETAKLPQFNNARAIIILTDQNSWATCGTLRQRLQSCAPTWIFCVVRWAVREKAKVQQRRWRKWCMKQSKLNSEHQWLEAAPRWHNGQTYHKTSSTKLLVTTLVSRSGN